MGGRGSAYPMCSFRRFDKCDMQGRRANACSCVLAQCTRCSSRRFCRLPSALPRSSAPEPACIGASLIGGHLWMEQAQT